MHKTFAFLLAVACVPAAGAQTFQPGRLQAATRDSFDVVYQAQTIGSFVLSSAKTGENITMTGQVSLAAMGLTGIDSVVFNATTLSPILMTSSQSAMGNSASTRVTIGGGKATGTAQQPSASGIQTVRIDAPVAPGVIGDGSDALLIPTLDFSDALTTTFQVFDAKSGKTRATNLKVIGKEAVTVPAGSIESWKVELTGEESVTLWVSVAEPRRLVMLRLEGQQLEMKRANK